MTADRRYTLEAVRAGYDLHYGDRADDGALLDGDADYARGLDRVAAAGDLEAVGELAQLIADVARAHAEGDPDRAEERWRETTRRLAEPSN